MLATLAAVSGAPISLRNELMNPSWVDRLPGTTASAAPLLAVWVPFGGAIVGIADGALEPPRPRADWSDDRPPPRAPAAATAPVIAVPPPRAPGLPDAAPVDMAAVAPWAEATGEEVSILDSVLLSV